MRELLAMNRLVITVDIDISDSPKTRDERCPHAVTIRGSAVTSDLRAQRRPHMRITAQTPLAMDDVKAIPEQALAGSVRAPPASRAVEHAVSVTDRLKSGTVFSAGVRGLPAGVNSFHVESLLRQAPGHRMLYPGASPTPIESFWHALWPLTGHKACQDKDLTWSGDPSAGM